MEPIRDSRGYAVERRVCPEHFQERIRQVAGTNRYGEDNYKLVWAQTETTIGGGEWEALGETFRGYRPCYLSDGLPHWVLVKWIDAGKSLEMPFLPAQGPGAFYAENQCPKTGLQLLGGYPYHGNYQVALPLVAKWFANGKLNLRFYPLDTEIVEMMIPVIQASMILTSEAKRRFLKEQNEKDELEADKQFEAMYNDLKVDRRLAASQWIQDEERKIERAFNAAATAKVMGFSKNTRFQSDRPI
jgi:hypothetical protein